MTGESDESELTRRDALEKGGSVAAFGSFGLLGGAAKAQSKGDEPDWDVTGVDWLEGSEVGQNLKYAMSGKYAGDLKKKIQSAGFRPAPKRAAAGQINTSSAEVNATRPVQLLLPFVPKGQKKKDGDLSGLIIATVAGQNNDRQLVNAVGSTVEGPEGDRTAKLYGNTSESGVDIGVIRETKANGSQVGTSQSLPCATCQLIVGTSAPSFRAKSPVRFARKRASSVLEPAVE